LTFPFFGFGLSPAARIIPATDFLIKKAPGNWSQDVSDDKKQLNRIRLTNKFF